MPATYSWVIVRLERHPKHARHSDVVSTIHWRRQATDGAHTVDVYGAQDVTFDAKSPFTHFERLTKAQIEGWLEKAMGADRIAELNANLDRQIESQISAPATTSALPWAQA